MDRGLQTTLHRALLIDRLTNHIQNTAQSARTDRNHDGGTSVLNLLPTNKSFGGLHGNSTNSVLAEMLGYLQDKTRAALGDLHLQGVEDGRQSTVELNSAPSKYIRNDITTENSFV